MTVLYSPHWLEHAFDKSRVVLGERSASPIPHHGSHPLLTRGPLRPLRAGYVGLRARPYRHLHGARGRAFPVPSGAVGRAHVHGGARRPQRRHVTKHRRSKRTQAKVFILSLSFYFCLECHFFLFFYLRVADF